MTAPALPPSPEERYRLLLRTSLLTCMDAFRIVGVFFLVCIPLLLLFKRRRGAGGPIEVAMH